MRISARSGDPEDRARTSVLLTYVRWPGAAASIVQALLVLQGPGRWFGVGLGVAMAAYNLLPLAAARTGRLNRVAPAAAAVGDFGAAAGWTALTAGDPHSLAYTYFAFNGIEAAFLYGRLGALVATCAYLVLLAAFTFAGTPAFAGPVELGLVYRAGLVVLLTAFAAGVAEHFTADRRRLRTAEEQTRTILESDPSAVITADGSLCITGWNRRAERTFGWSAEEVLGRTLPDVLTAGAAIPGDFRPGARRLTGTRRSGEEFPLEVVVTDARTPSGAGQVIVFAGDVTYRDRSEALQAARYGVTFAINQAYSLEDGVPRVLEGVCLALGWSAGTLWRVDPALGALRFEALWHADGLSGEELEEGARGLLLRPGAGLPGKAWAAGATVTIPDLARVEGEREQALAAQGLHGGIAFPVSHGDEVSGVLEFYTHSSLGADDDTLVAMADIGVQVGQWLDREAIRSRLRLEEEARRAAEERARRALEFRAFHDMLTGLPNRLLFADRLGQRLALARRERKPVAVLMLDVDNFKQVNDELGHFAGDLVLEEVAHRLRGALRSSDTAARMGGDEFAILPGGDVDRAAVERIVGKVRSAFTATPWVVEGHRVELGVSIGCAFYPEDGEEAGGLLECADAAMYDAKRRAAAAGPEAPA